jgi:3-methylcrotonyl-CoA carboxylase alpha subunit
MSLFSFSDRPAQRHVVTVRHDGVVVDGMRIAVRSAGAGDFIASVNDRSERLHAVARGDVIHVQLRGRAWRIERIDPTHSQGNSAVHADGAMLAPMPGVVISLLVEREQVVRRGDPLLVIESMKLQMTIGAETGGVVTDLPLAVGQTFQRGALLARVAAAEGRV